MNPPSSALLDQRTPYFAGFSLLLSSLNQSVSEKGHNVVTFHVGLIKHRLKQRNGEKDVSRNPLRPPKSSASYRSFAGRIDG